MSEKTIKKIRKVATKPELSTFTVNKDNIDEVLRGIAPEEEPPMFIVVDLFCGAGGTTTGFARLGNVIKIIGCVNHDFHAIKSHWINHPSVVHFEEDIKLLNVHLLKRLVDHYRALYPLAKFILWASLECTNFSKAKGGQERDADSRTLAQSLYMCWDETIDNGVDSEGNERDKGGYVPGDSYVQILQPDYVMIENVVEFMSWGPLDENKKPVSKKNGRDWMKWRNEMCSFGYSDDWKEMNSADFGAYTSRNRLFGIFAKDGLPKAWPLATHAKNPGKGDLFSRLEKWQAVKEVLDFSDEGTSIFINLVPIKTQKKAMAYLLKKLKKEPKEAKKIVVFPSMMKDVCYGMEPKLVLLKKDAARFDEMIREYCDKLDISEADISFYRYDPYSEKTLDRLYAGLVKFVAGGKVNFLAKMYATASNGHGTYDTDSVAHSITTRDGHNLVQVDKAFISRYNGGKPESRNTGMDEPCRVVTTENRHALIQPVPFLSKNFSGDPESKNDDTPGIKKIKEFMALYGIVDIKMRMLKVRELLSIQGFPESYQLCGPLSEQKKQIGNSVETTTAMKWGEALIIALDPEYLSSRKKAA